MSSKFESPGSVVRRNPLSSIFVLSMGALGGLMWSISGDRSQVLDIWKMILLAEAGAVAAASLWLIESYVLGRIFRSEEPARIRRGDALTFLPLVFSLLITMNLVFQAGTLNLLVSALVILLFVGAKIVEIVWLIIPRRTAWLKASVPALLSILLVASMLGLAWRAFAGKPDYWTDRETVSIPGEDVPYFDGSGAQKLYVNAMGVWRPSTKMAGPSAYRAVVPVSQPGAVSMGFIAADGSAQKVRVKIRSSGGRLIEDAVETGEKWTDISWPVATGEAEITVSPAGGVVFASDPSVEYRKQRPNIILIVIDTLRADHLGSYGYSRDTSPNIDAVAKKGLLFENHFSATSWSTSAVATIFTGLYPTQHGCVDFSQLFLPLELETFAEPLSRAGYRTVGISGNPLLSIRSYFMQGFDSFDEACFGNVYWKSGQCMTDQALEDARGDRPMFLFMQYFDPHAPYAAPRPEWLMFTGWPFEYNPGPVLKFITNRYDEMIRYNDRQVGRLLDGLKKMGVLDNAILIITADHGEELGEHGRVTHGYTVYDEVTHVPLIIAGPGVHPGRVHGLTSSVDLFPTLLAIAGVAPGENSQGNNLLELPTPTREFILADNLEQTAVRTLKWKLIADNNKRREMLFDMEADPTEQNDVANEHPEVRAHLHEVLEGAIKKLGNIRPPTNHAIELQLQMNKRLHALGYLR